MAKIDDSALDAIFRSARSANGYNGDPITEDDIRQIYDLLKMGPTSANQQPARFVWCLSQESKDKLAACSSGNNAPKIKAAPAAVVIGMDLEFNEQLPWLFPHAPDAKHWFADNEARYTHAFRNSSLQGAYFIVAARALGIDVGPMSGFDHDAVDAAFFGDQPNVKTNFISTLGFADHTTIFDRLPRPTFDQFNKIV
jgi:3-hydroxypropanoate dehydrogenase